MKAHLLIGAAALALACGTAAGNDGPEASDVSLENGKWELRTELVSIASEGMPPEDVERMKTQGVGTAFICVRPGETAQGIADRLAGNSSAICRNEGFDWSGGRIRGKRTCTAGGVWTSTTMNGTLGTRGMDVTITSEARRGREWLTMARRTTGRRVGDCRRLTGRVEK